MQLSPLKIASGITFVIAAILFLGSCGNNPNGYRTVIQTPTGYTYVKFAPGPYLSLFGTATQYPDYVTFDFDKKQDNDETATLQQPGIDVRYQEGGTGTVFGQVRFALPTDEESMLALHRGYRSTEGVASKLVRPSVEQIVTLTAKLMTSDESYSEKSAVFTEWTREQMVSGAYRTELKGKQVKDETATEGEKTVYKEVPVISIGQDGLPQFSPSDLKTFGVKLASLQLVDWGYEEKTIAQIQARREATMEIITAKANAERAKQDAITAEETGKRDVVKAKYEKEVEKERAIVIAQQAKEVATIAGEQKVKVAEQSKLEAEQLKLAAGEYKQEQTLRGEGDAAYKKAVIDADGALQQKLDAYKYVAEVYAREFGRQKWVPEIVLGGAPNGQPVNEASNLINLLTTKTAKDLSLDLGIPTRNTAEVK